MRHFNKLLKSSLLILILSCQPALTAFANELKVLSYNVYFDDTTGKNRYPQIIELIKNGNFNVIALQECTARFIELLLNDQYFQEFTIAFGDSTHGYQNILLTSLATKSHGEIKLTTHMGRSAPYLTLADLDTQIINVHLESGLSDQSARKKQLTEILQASQHSQNVIITGDFNFGDGAEEELLLQEFNDLGKKDNKMTYDTENNLIAQKTKFLFEKSRRLDRIFLKCNNCKSTVLNVLTAKYSDHWPISAVITQ